MKILVTPETRLNILCKQETEQIQPSIDKSKYTGLNRTIDIK